MKTAIFSRKAPTLKDIGNPLYQDTGATPYRIIETIQLASFEYDAMAKNLFADCGPLMGKGGTDADGTARCLLVKAPRRKSLLINPEGYSYARYVAFA